MESKRQRRKNQIIVSDGEGRIQFTDIETHVTLEAARYAEKLITGVRPEPYTRVRRPPKRERYVLIRNSERSIIWSGPPVQQAREMSRWITTRFFSAPPQQFMTVQ